MVEQRGRFNVSRRPTLSYSILSCGNNETYNREAKERSSCVFSACKMKKVLERCSQRRSWPGGPGVRTPTELPSGVHAKR